MTIRILNVLMERAIGGPQLRVLQVAEGLKPQGFETIVAIPRGQGGIATLLTERGIQFHEIPYMNRIRQTWNPWTNLWWGLTYWPGVFHLMRVIRRERIDIVHQNTIESTQGAVAARLAGARVVWHVNGIPHPLVSSIFKKLIPSLAHSVAVPSNEFARRFFGDSPPRVSGGVNVLYPPVDISRFQDSRGDGFRESLGIPTESLLVGTVGNVNPLKGHLDFIHAANIVGRQLPDAHFVIVGAKLATRRSYFDGLQREVQKLDLETRFHFAGFQVDIPAVLASLDVYVHPSHTEALPMAVEEAMASSTAVIATDVGGLSELLPDSSFGVLVPPREPEAIANAILHLADNPGEAQLMASKAAERVACEFSLTQTVTCHRELYEREAGRAKTPSVAGVQN